jgi:hypothetical protein
MNAIGIGLDVLHAIIGIYIVVGCFLPKWTLKYHIAIILFVLIQFRITNNKCVLTIMQDSIQYKSATVPVPFIKRMFSYVGIPMSNTTVRNLVYGVLTVSALISCGRLLQ